MKENVIFLHVPKTAGSTVNRILDRQYPADVIYTIEGDTLAALEKFEKLSPEKREKIRVFRGHGEYGIHSFLNGKSKYFTFLRNPIDRVISEYYFTLRSPGTPHHRYVRQNNLSLKEAVESKDPLVMLPNSQTILLAGAWRSGVKECNAEVLERAKENLRSHFIVGLTERFDESICLIQNAFQWPRKVTYMKHNVAKNRPERAAISEATLEAIKRANQYDSALYEYAKGLFVEQTKQAGSQFPYQVRLFKLRNQVYQYTRYVAVSRLWHRLPFKKK